LFGNFGVRQLLNYVKERGEELTRRAREGAGMSFMTIDRLKVTNHLLKRLMEPWSRIWSG
jgi:hypothetical protein